MWIDSFTPIKLQSDSYGKVVTYEAGPDEYIKCIVNHNGGTSAVKALDSSGVVFGNGDDYDTAERWQLIPGQQMIGNFKKVSCNFGSVIIYIVPKDTQL